MNNKKAVEIFDEVKEKKIPFNRLGEFFHAGEDESINIDALTRKLRGTKDNLMKKREIIALNMKMTSFSYLYKHYQKKKQGRQNSKHLNQKPLIWQYLVYKKISKLINKKWMSPLR